MTKRDLAYWNLSAGDFVRLTDEDSLRDGLDWEGTMDGINLEVVDEEVFNFDHGETLVVYRLHHREQDLFLTVNSFENDFDVAVYYQEEGLQGDRKDIDNEGMLELIFNVDSGGVLDEFLYNETILKDEDDTQIEYDQNNSIVTIGDEEFCIVTRYTADEGEDPLLLIIEEGHVEDPNGGMVRAFWGDPVRTSEIEVWR